MEVADTVLSSGFKQHLAVFKLVSGKPAHLFSRMTIALHIFSNRCSWVDLNCNTGSS